MKNGGLLSIFLLLFIFISCDKSEEEFSKEVNVVQYVDLLIRGKYSAVELPSFTEADIPQLLEYRNSRQKISNFPTNWISSYWTEESTLGIYVLWTIESIRAVAVDSELLTGRFPSQNPVVGTRSTPFEMVPDEESLDVVAEAYMDWWQKNRDIDFEQFKTIDPLLETGLKWH